MPPKSAYSDPAMSPDHSSTHSDSEKRLALARAAMVEEQIRARGVNDLRVLEALRAVPRHQFVSPDLSHLAYTDRPLPIGLGQTISQPYIVALMTELVRPRRGGRALDVGTGSGYQAAVLAEMGMEVYGIEILCPLADSARERLAVLGYSSVEVRCGDGYAGWPEHAPFDSIVVAAAAPQLPQPLIDQLAPGGRLVIPIGDDSQRLMVYEKAADGKVRGFSAESVIFVPMTGEVRAPKTK